ncbi:hypothetical protein EXIGLDRAFT_196817 [Exidia glandulosa HHB12029]|uniref:Fungal-type protein kinase domain-containing protein n=1 Tax=Exidia glandulosa HHB12029 TaxID=1314781 RepID=A0A165ETE5_EXIGL|nr:hypothetical protein EXIGLDRAFT_196817 [Exidia glandulosa HHB12029]
MFSALEISTDKPLERVLDPFALDNVIRKLRAVEQLPVFDRAFPDGKGDFVEMLEAVTELEFTRKRFLSKSADRKAANDIRQRFTDPKKILHDPCYDVQSIYWSLLWFFLRALPTGKPPLDVLDGDFSRFANSLLEHTVGDDAFRADHFFQWRGPTLELHAALADFVPLFQNLAAYLAIPWHMYKNHPEVHVPNDHAHTAVRRLLLAEIYALTKENKGLNIALDPTQPRIINKSTSAVTDRSKQPAFRDSTRTSKRRAADAGLDEDHSDGKRRKVELEDSEDDDDDSDSDEEAKAPSTLPNPGRVVPGHRCYQRKCNPKSAGARAEKLRDDRYLFFGVGSRKPLQTAAAATGN